jgi:hypothetical protein
MAVTPYDVLIDDFSSSLITELAPEEMPLYRPISEDYFKNPQRVLDEQSAKDDVLGFGATEVGMLLTPVVLAVMTEVVTFIVTEVKKSLKEEGADVIQNVVRRLFRKQPAAATQAASEPALSAEQVSQIHAIAFEQARKLRLSEPRAKLLADAVAGSLMVS